MIETGKNRKKSKNGNSWLKIKKRGEMMKSLIRKRQKMNEEVATKKKKANNEKKKRLSKFNF